MNIILCGFMGSGKTVVGKELAKIMGQKFIDTDEYIEKKYNMSVKAIFTVHGEEYFRKLEQEVCEEIGLIKSAVISTGGGTLMSQANVSALKKNGQVVFLDASFDIICDRIGNNTTRPLFQDRQKAKQLYEERKSKYSEAADYIIDGNMSARKTALDIATIFK